MFLKPRWRKVLADFWENKARSILVIASIFIGVFAIGLIMVSDSILPSSLLTTYEASNPANIILRTELFDQDLIDRVSRIDGVKAVSARKTISVRARTVEQETWENLDIVVIQDLENLPLKQLTLLEGAQPAFKDEIVLLQEALADFPVSAGDSLEIQLQDDTIRNIAVTGIVKDYSAGIEITVNRRIAYADDIALSFLHSDDRFDTLYISVEGDQRDIDHIEGIAYQISDAIEDAGYRVNSLKTQGIDQHPHGNYIEAVNVILSFMGFLVVILSTFLIINMMNSLMGQQIRQIGVMKLIGAQTADIARMYLVLVLGFGLIAFLIGVPAASFAAYVLSSRIAILLNGQLISGTVFPIVLKAILVQAAVAFVVPMCASIVPILRGAKTNVQQALDNSLIKNQKESSRFDRWLEHLKGINGILLLSVRNTFRRKGRLVLTLFTLSLGGAIFIGVFNVQAVLYQHIQTISNYCNADIFLNFNRPYPIQEILPLIDQLQGVTAVEGWTPLSAQLETGSQIELVYLEAPPDGSELLGPVVHSGRWVREDEEFGIVVNEDFYRSMPDMIPGDPLTLTFDGKAYEFTIVGIFNYTGLQDKRAYINERTATEINGSWSKTQSYRLVTSEPSLEDQLVMVDTINDYFRDIGYDVARVSSLSVIIDEAGEKIDIVINVLFILAMLTGLVGSIGLSGTLSLNVLERTSEIGILRAIGAHNQIVSKLVIFEGLFIGLASYLIGFVMSFPISIVLGNLVNQAIFGAEARLIINPVGFLVWLGLVLLMSIIASLLPARNAARLTIREVLAYE